MFKNLIPSCTAVSKPGFLRRCAASPQFAPHNSRNLHKLPLFRNQRCFWHPNESTHLSGKPTFLRPLFIRWPLPAGNCTANSDIHTQVVRMFSSRGDKKTRSQAAAAEKEKYMRMTRTEKRKVYRCGKNYNTLEEVPTWPVFYSENKDRLLKLYRKQLNKASSKYEVNEKLNNKISIWKGDITTLESDSIVNAANSSLLGGGGVDGAIHGAAGSALKAECALLQGCETGDAKITGGYKLPSKYVIHTVGPIGGNEPKLRSCYQKCLQIMAQEKLRSVAFPCISTGIYGYPNEAAAPVALESAREFLEKYSDKVDRIIFCLFMRVDVLLYEELMQYYFPIGDKTSEPQGKAVDETKAQTEQSEDDEDSKENEKVLEGVRGEEREPEGTQDTKLEDIKDDTTTENVTEDDTKRIKVDSENGTDEAVSCHKKISTGAMEGETENTTPASEHQEPTSAKEEQPAASETKLTASDTDEATVTEMKESSASDIEQPDDTKMTTDTEMKDDTIIKTKL